MKKLIILSAGLMFSSLSYAQLSYLVGGPTTVGSNPTSASFLYKRYSYDLNTSMFNNQFGGDVAIQEAWMLGHAHTVGSPWFDKAVNICKYKTPNYHYAITNGYVNNGLIYQSHGPVNFGMTRFEYIVVCSD